MQGMGVWLGLPGKSSSSCYSVLQAVGAYESAGPVADFEVEAEAESDFGIEPAPGVEHVPDFEIRSGIAAESVVEFACC